MPIIINKNKQSQVYSYKIACLGKPTLPIKTGKHVIPTLYSLV